MGTGTLARCGEDPLALPTDRAQESIWHKVGDGEAVVSPAPLLLTLLEARGCRKGRKGEGRRAGPKGMCHPQV